VAVVRYTFTHKQCTEQHNETEYTEWNINKKKHNLQKYKEAEKHTTIYKKYKIEQKNVINETAI